MPMGWKWTIALIQAGHLELTSNTAGSGDELARDRTLVPALDDRRVLRILYVDSCACLATSPSGAAAGMDNMHTALRCVGVSTPTNPPSPLSVSQEIRSVKLTVRRKVQKHGTSHLILCDNVVACCVMARMQEHRWHAIFTCR